MSDARQAHFAGWMLMLATLAWALSFSFGKEAGHALNLLSGQGEGAVFGPVALQGVRFLIGAALWFAIFPQARRGWTWTGVLRGVLTGLPLAAGIGLQHVALDRTSPAVTAFLTSLSVLWVPLLACLLTRRLPAWFLGVGVLLALAGLYLMTGEGLTQFRSGEWLGLACSLGFTVHLLVLNHTVRRENAFRICGAQFLVCGLCLLIPAIAFSGVSAVDLAGHIVSPQVGWKLAVLVAFPTLVAFGLGAFYQPRVDPTRAVLIYMLEPVLAAGFDYLAFGRGMGGGQLLGAGLILAATAIAELGPLTRAESGPGTLASGGVTEKSAWSTMRHKP